MSPGKAGFFMLIGLALIYSFGSDLYYGYLSSSWPKTEATIVSDTTTISTSRSGTHHHAHISFRYAIAGRQYVSNQVAFDSRMGESNAAAWYVETYPEGRLVDAYYQPDNPGNAVLIPGVQTGAMIGCGLGIIVTVVLGVAVSRSSRWKGE